MTDPARWFLVALLLCVATVLSIIAWQLLAIRQRKREADRLVALGFLFDTEDDYRPNAPILEGRQIPRWRKLLGDETYVRFDLIPPDETLARRLESYFPEAMIVENGEVRPSTSRPGYP